MRQYYCNHCAKETLHKRFFSGGSIALAWLTGGFWLLAMPFYPIRCSICKSKLEDPSSLSKSKKDDFQQLKKYGITAAVIVLVVIALSWFAGKSDKRTPEQKQQDAQGEVHQQKTGQFASLMLSEPCVKLDDKPVTVALDWSSEEVSFVAPKTYSFTGARFTTSRVSISKNDFLKAEEYGDHVFISVPVQKREGYSPSFYSDTVYVSIPKNVIPDSFKKSQK